MDFRVKRVPPPKPDIPQIKNGKIKWKSISICKFNYE